MEGRRAGAPAARDQGGHDGFRATFRHLGYGQSAEGKR